MDEPMKQSNDKSASKDAPATGKNALEWTVFGLSLLLVTATFGWLVYQALHLGTAPPRLEISLGAPVKAGTQMLVPVKVENRGDSTAAGVEIEVERRSGKSGAKETASFSFAHLPRSSQREGWVAFEAPLHQDELSAKIVGYEEP